MRFYEFNDVSNPKATSRNARRVSATPIADPIKRKFVQDRLTRLLARQRNMIHPTMHDLTVAIERVRLQQKRANLDYKRLVQDQLR